MTKVLLYKSHSGEGSSSVSTKILHLRLVYESVGNCLLRILHSDPKSHKVLCDRYEVLRLAHILLFSVLFSRIAPNDHEVQHLLVTKEVTLALLFERNEKALILFLIFCDHVFWLLPKIVYIRSGLFVSGTRFRTLW